MAQLQVQRKFVEVTHFSEAIGIPAMNICFLQSFKFTFEYDHTHYYYWNYFSYHYKDKDKDKKVDMAYSW